ncbi:hypothetical protein TNCT_422001 [Trichonephila clavata]|uniref:Uncharacterized protein n=1 Tax=Trichonephila clavata TaxID=2740835 RepID=A0A8X6GVY3_TRICU|nr:hypothetical protein TNCT_422001 [Trichonephila clavata]
MSIGKHFGQHEAAVGIIKKDEAAIGRSVCSGTKLCSRTYRFSNSDKSSSHAREIDKEELESTVVMWIAKKSTSRRKNVLVVSVDWKSCVSRIGRGFGCSFCG